MLAALQFDPVDRVRVLLSPDPSATFEVRELGAGLCLSVGRAPGVGGLAIDDPALSRRHLRIRVAEAGSLVLEDLASHNGSWCNRAPLFGALQIWSDAVLRLGKTIVHVGPGLPGEGTEAWARDRLLTLGARRALELRGAIGVLGGRGTGLRTLAREMQRLASVSAQSGLTILRPDWTETAAAKAMELDQAVLLLGAHRVDAGTLARLANRAEAAGRLLLLGACGAWGAMTEVLPPDRLWVLPRPAERRAAVWSVTRGLLHEYFGPRCPEFSPGALNLWLCAPLEEGWRTLRERCQRLIVRVGAAPEVRARDVRATFELAAASSRSSARRMGRPDRDDLAAALSSLSTIRGVAEYFRTTRRQVYRWMAHYELERPQKESSAVLGSGGAGREGEVRAPQREDE